MHRKSPLFYKNATSLIVFRMKASQKENITEQEEFHIVKDREQGDRKNINILFAF